MAVSGPIGGDYAQAGAGGVNGGQLASPFVLPCSFPRDVSSSLWAGSASGQDACLAAMPTSTDESMFVPVGNPHVLVMGRVDRTDASRLRAGYPGVTLRVAFRGRAIAIHTNCTSPNCRLAVIVDGGAPKVIRLPEGTHETELACGLDAAPHQLDIVRRTEFWQGTMEVIGMRLGHQAELGVPTPFNARRLLFIGDSVTCGEGVDRLEGSACHDKTVSSDAYNSYGMFLGRALNAQCHLVSHGGRGLIRDYLGDRKQLTAPQFFELALPTSEPRVTWDHGSYVPDGVFVSLGTNDFNLAIGEFPDEVEFVGAYVAFLKRLRSLYPAAQVLVTEGAIVTDEKRPQRSTLCRYIDRAVAEMRDAKIHAIRSTRYPGDAFDRHPTSAQHRQMARDFEPIMRSILGW